MQTNLTPHQLFAELYRTAAGTHMTRFELCLPDGLDCDGLYPVVDSNGYYTGEVSEGEEEGAVGVE